MKNLFEQIKLLHEQELYSNVVHLCSLAITICDQKPDIVTPLSKFNMYIQYADSLFQLEQYLKAERIYFQALQQRKHMLKNKTVRKPVDNNKDIPSDTETRYKLYLCYMKMKQDQKAINVLLSISAKSRTPKMNMALGNLYRNSGMERSAIACYKEVLRESPLALEAAEGLLALGVKGIEVNSLMLEGTSDVNTSAWINQWLRSQAEMQARDYKKAVTTFLSMDVPGLLRDNVTLLVTLGKCYHYCGDTKKAINTLQRAVTLDPQNQVGLDVLAAALYKDNNVEDLERLIPVDLDVNLYAPEHWIGMAYYMYATKKYAKAAYFAQKACIMAPRNVEALILKGSILLELKKYTDATVHIRDAMQISAYRFEPHELLVSCYIGLNRLREALTVASNACKQLGQTSRALTLYASVLMRDPISIPKAKSFLEKALRVDQENGLSPYLESVYLLVDCYEQEMALESASALLNKYIDIEPTSKLHQMLGDVLKKLYESDKAFEHYNISLNLDPKNRRAMEGLHSLGRHSGSSKLENNYYMGTGSSSQAAGEGGTGSSVQMSDHEQDAESDSESWPHIELQPTFQ